MYNFPMKSISFWAKTNYKTARILITIVQIALLIGAIYIGTTLEQIGIKLSTLFCFIAIGILLIAAAIYPSKAKQKNRYIFQKICDIITAAAVFCCICFFSNNSNRIASINTSTMIYGSFATSSSNENESPITATTSKKALKKQVTATIKELRKYKSISAGKVLGILLVVVLSCVLILFLAALSCSLSCSGSGAAASILLFGGLAGVILLAALVIRRILGNNSATEKKSKLSGT
jgi:hypothetical protein